jgi:hypothetical protein
MVCLVQKIKATHQHPDIRLASVILYMAAVRVWAGTDAELEDNDREPEN